MKKATFKTISTIVALATTSLIGLNSTMMAYADVPADGYTNAEEFANANGASLLWEDWKSNWDTIKTDWSIVSIAPGSNETEMNFAWYSLDKVTTFTVSQNSDMSNPIVSSEVTGYAHDSIKQGDTQYYACKTTITDLTSGTYYYQIGNKDISTFDVQDTTDGFSFLFIGDPQIGSSNSMKGSKADTEEKLETFYSLQSDAVMNDAFNWNYTLNQAITTSPNASFILSAGDQIQSREKDAPLIKTDNTYSEIEYTGFLSASVLQSLPFAPTVGNHDCTLANYTYHFNTPNNSELGSNGIVGGDYWFTYGDALFIMLNTQDTNTEEHQQFMEEAISLNPDVTWKFVTVHQDIYGSAEHSNEPEITNLRYELIPYFEQYDIDVVFSGHDHAYSRTNILQGGEKTNTYYDELATEEEYDEVFEYDIDAGENPTEGIFVAYQNITNDTTDLKHQAYLSYLYAVEDIPAIENLEYSNNTDDNETVVNPEGILYMTAGSSSGSKYYDLTSRMQSYVADRWQEDIPTYSVVELTDTTFTINTYRTDTNEKIDKEFTIVKTPSTEPDDTILGDVQGDGNVNSADLLILKKYLIGLNDATSINTSNADINKDGSINSADLLILKKVLLGLIEL